MCCGCNPPSAPCSWRTGRTTRTSAGSDQWASSGETFGEMFQCSFPVPLTSICFEDKIKFSASQDLALARRKWLKPGDRVNQSDELSSRPPDFSIRLFKCLKVPQSRDEKMLSNSSKPRRTKATQTVVPVVLQSRQRKEEPRKFIARYRPPDSLEVELRFVRNGKFPAAPYKNPKPHDFRPVSLLKTRLVWWLILCLRFLFQVSLTLLEKIKTWKAKGITSVLLHLGAFDCCSVKFDHKVAVNEKVYDLL